MGSLPAAIQTTRLPCWGRLGFSGVRVAQVRHHVPYSEPLQKAGDRCDSNSSGFIGLRNRMPATPGGGHFTVSMRSLATLLTEDKDAGGT